MEAGPISVAGLERLVDHLPADVRARLVWSPTETRNALRAFLESDKGNEALNKLVDIIIRQWRAITPAVDALTEHPELFRSQLEATWRADSAALQNHLDEDAANAADWVMRVFRAFVDWSLAKSVEHPKPAEAELDAGFAAFVQMPGSPTRVQALMMAAFEAAKSPLSDDVTSELVFRAFDETALLLRLVQSVGIHLDPFRDETPAERGARARRYAERFRAAMTVADSEVLEASRLRSLR